MSVSAPNTWSRAPAETILDWLARLAGPCVLALLLWASQLTLQLGVAVPPDDGSYQSAMDHFLATGARCGVDWIYTYGPLGACQALTFHPEIVWTKLLVWELLFKGCLALALVRALWRAGGPFQRVVPYLALLFAPGWGDGYTFAGLLACVDLALERPESRVRTLGVLVVLGLAALSKNTALFLALPVLAALVYSRWRLLGVRSALGFAGAFVAFWCGVWVACGQSLLDVPRFFLHSLQLAAAYNAGLATEPPEGIDVLALCALVCGLACAFVVHWTRLRDTVLLARALVHAGFWFVAFKAGLVRASDHTTIFVQFACVALFLGAPLAELARGPRRALAFSLRWGTFAALLPLSFWLVGFTQETVTQIAFRLGQAFDTAIAFVSAPRAHVAAAASDYRFVKKLRVMPLSAKAIGKRTVDIHPPFQDVVLMNGFDWRPRPVFQPYAVLSRELELVNARFLESDRAPQFYLLRFFPMDGHMPAMEDAAALIVLARDYTPVLREDGYLLLQREPPAVRVEMREVVLDRQVRLDERLDLTGLASGCLLLQLEATPTFGGRFRAALLRPAGLFALVELEGGATRYVRIVPEMLAGGAILSPWIDTPEDWLRWQNGTAARVNAITIRPSPVEDFWSEDVRVRIVHAADVVPRAAARSRQLLSEYPMFENAPARLQTMLPPAHAIVDGELALEVGSNAALYYEVAAGRHRVRGDYGLLPAAYERGVSNGVRFQLLARTRDGTTRTLLREFLDPRTRADHRGMRHFDVEFECSEPSELIFHTLPGPRGDTVDDRAYWTNLAVGS